MAFGIEKAAKTGDLIAAGEDMAELEAQFQRLKNALTEAQGQTAGPARSSQASPEL